MEIHFFPTVKTPASSYINITSAEKKKKKKSDSIFTQHFFLSSLLGEWIKKISTSLFFFLSCVFNKIEMRRCGPPSRRV